MTDEARNTKLLPTPTNGLPERCLAFDPTRVNIQEPNDKILILTALVVPTTQDAPTSTHVCQFYLKLINL